LGLRGKEKFNLLKLKGEEERKREGGSSERRHYILWGEEEKEKFSVLKLRSR
jgi:hypothetical protein